MADFNNRGRDGEDALDEKTVYINRCAKTVKGGRRFSFSAIVVVGDKNGKVGLGIGKANETGDAIRKGGDAARKNMRSVCMKGSSIPHEVYGVCDGGKFRGDFPSVRLALFVDFVADAPHDDRGVIAVAADQVDEVALVPFGED